MTQVSSRRERFRSSWSSVFGVVPDQGLERRPTEIIRAFVGLLCLALGILTATAISPLEQSAHDVIDSLPDAILHGLRWMNLTGALLAGGVVLLAALLSRRPRFIGSVLLAAALAAGLTILLRQVIDAPHASGGPPGGYPEFPNLRLSVLAAVFFVSGPEITRPARRLMWVLLASVAVSLSVVTNGYPTGFVGGVGLGLLVASIVHLILGSPDGAPSTEAVTDDLGRMGITALSVESSPTQSWGETAFDATDATGRLRVVVIGRDATNAQFLTKLLRFIWMKDSGPSLVVNREQQIEHRAYVLMLAERAGVPAATVVDSGLVGARGDVLLVLREPTARRLDTLEPAEVTPALQTEAWRALASLHGIGISHGSVRASTLLVSSEGTVSFEDLAASDARPAPAALLADQVAMLLTLADRSDASTAVAAARTSLGDDGLGALLPLLQQAALARATRKELRGPRALVESVRTEITSVTGVEAPKLTELRRAAPSSIILALATLLGFYLLVGQFTKIDFATTFNDAHWVWIPVVVLMAQLPLLGTAMALLGSVSRPLPLRPVLILQFASKFTGLVGGGVATMAMIVRFFQKQGLSPAVAVSSSLMTSFASGIVQVVVVSLGLLLGDATFHLKVNDAGSLESKLLIALGVVVLVALVLTAIPRFRRRLTDLVGPHLAAARTNFARVVSEPRKAVQLFAGNLLAQVCYALVLWAALHAYGQSLGLMQLIVINSIASIIGGLAPVPGGMGVIEAGLIAGFTAAGVPDQEAIAATFTARMFTAYLPPVWGWVAMQWLHRGDYI